jgi:hypothetical protein
MERRDQKFKTSPGKMLQDPMTLRLSENWGNIFLQSDKVYSSLLGVGEH